MRSNWISLVGLATSISLFGPSHGAPAYGDVPAYEDASEPYANAPPPAQESPKGNEQPPPEAYPVPSQQATPTNAPPEGAPPIQDTPPQVVPWPTCGTPDPIPNPIPTPNPVPIPDPNTGFLGVLGVQGTGIQVRREIRDLVGRKEEWNLFILALAKFQAMDQEEKFSYYSIAGKIVVMRS